MKTITIAMATCMLLLAACSKKTETPANSISFHGTVTYIDLEGGAWILVADGGERYQPINMDSRYHVEGLRVAVIAEAQPEMASTLMVGTIIRIIEIRRL